MGHSEIEVEIKEQAELFPWPEQQSGNVPKESCDEEKPRRRGKLASYPNSISFHPFKTLQVILSEGRVKTPGGKTDQTQPSKHLNIKFEDYSEVKCNQTSSVKTPELEKFLEVPWEVPKLRKKIDNRRKMKTLVNLQGSDSGLPV